MRGGLKNDWEDGESLKEDNFQNIVRVTHCGVCAPFRQQRSTGVEAFVSRMAVDKYVYLSKNRTSTVEVWDKRSEKLVDCIDCGQIVRYTKPQTCFNRGTS